MPEPSPTADQHAAGQPGADQHAAHLTRGVPETVLPALDPGLAEELEVAHAGPIEDRHRALADLAARQPRCLEAWASLAELAEIEGHVIEQYAFARVGYHRGLDGLRAAGWRGSGYVRWRHPENRGFLRALSALQRAACAIGETDEEQRCRQFLHQLDPEWPPAELAGGSDLAPAE